MKLPSKSVVPLKHKRKSQIHISVLNILFFFFTFVFTNVDIRTLLQLHLFPPERVVLGRGSMTFNSAVLIS